MIADREEILDMEAELEERRANIVQCIDAIMAAMQL